MRIIAVLSSTVLISTGAYNYTEVAPGHTPDLTGLPHHVGHPATRHLVEAAGATYKSGLFAGLAPGEAFYVAQLRNSRKGAEFTKDHPNVLPEDLKWGLVHRLA